MTKRVAIIDYGVGNLYSVNQACRHVGMEAVVTDDAAMIASADAIILPGVGAFAHAMRRLDSLKVTHVVKHVVNSGRPILGICLGFQLLFEHSNEMELTAGLALIGGSVEPLEAAVRASGHKGVIRAPNISWLPIVPPCKSAVWSGTLFDGVEPGSSMYFVHSFYAAPASSADPLAEADYCGATFCCAIERENIFGCQFHPEKSGDAGLHIYRNFAARLG